ncbi:hypothetical protein RhiirA5_367042 [Rhizophagus irregularis]|uniref:Ricin B lectin domain-containing protein n=1 Tax=Rhizophagus irregularis TaxID=588596 RepID=A0A2N0RV20_9GLOM|nr:hypothetical protein RhiirA5_367042 [Rhizophagus irregularis]PKC67144.1 hypothetical protein RhiirA1_393926 [Rhizophagus irregularis]CAB4467152.1 unnamed protein product [Rhizophagus irregularis]CAB5360194.1 unnamed protein product [Rhizophagus irregularis]
MKFTLFLLLLASLLAAGSSQELVFRIKHASSKKYWATDNLSRLVSLKDTGTKWLLTRSTDGKAFYISPYDSSESSLLSLTYNGDGKTLTLEGDVTPQSRQEWKFNNLPGSLVTIQSVDRTSQFVNGKNSLVSDTFNQPWVFEQA